jgi:hypothetical protein
MATDSSATEGGIPRLAQSQPRATELRLRSAIEKIQAGSPNYEEMEPFLRAAVKNQYSAVVPRLQSMGSIKSITFEGSQNGQDIYNVTFANGALVWGIALTPNGKIAALYFN